LMRELGAELGADVPALVSPGRWLATGAGERVQRLPDPSSALGLLLLPLDHSLSTAAVYAESDRLGLPRADSELAARARRLAAELKGGGSLPELLENDLQPAAVSLCPQIAGALEHGRQAGAEHVLVSGSGPTVVALFPGEDGLAGAEQMARALAGRVPAPICARTVEASFGQP